MLAPASQAADATRSKKDATSPQKSCQESKNLVVCFTDLWISYALTKRVETLRKAALAARKHRCVAKGVGAGFCFAQFLNEIEEI